MYLVHVLRMSIGLHGETISPSGLRGVRVPVFGVLVVCYFFCFVRNLVHPVRETYFQGQWLCSRPNNSMRFFF